MPNPSSSRRARTTANAYWALLVCAGIAAPRAAAPQPNGPSAAEPTLVRIREEALKSDWAWQRAAELTDEIGPRLSGSPELAAAVELMARRLAEVGATVTLQPVKISHWQRGDEEATLTEYPGRPAGITQRLHMTSLGGSGATPERGLEAPVVVVRDFDELMARAADVRGAIVLYDSRFDQLLAENGEAETAYGRAVAYRNRGPAEAARLGAAAALVRSVGGADYRLPHTGATVFGAGQAPIPAAALAVEDADLVKRLAARGPVRMRLRATNRTLPDADGHNVIADWRGSELPDEYVIVSGHLDSWDLGTGAVDDGAPTAAASGVLAVLAALNLRARRTIRFVAWTDEETDAGGARAYFAALGADAAASTHCAAIESDIGPGRTLGVQAAVDLASLPEIEPVTRVLAAIGAPVLERLDGEAGTDIAPLQRAGVPGFAPLVDTRHYFDYHHTAADTLDKVDPAALRSQVAAMAVLAFYLADRADCLPRYAIAP